ncbi:MAG: tetratricopeptide repeat protein [Burkholderiales bacterium]|nr:tetratricopeptide repeat protein [Burkholderiales bacterium]
MVAGAAAGRRTRRAGAGGTRGAARRKKPQRAQSGACRDRDAGDHAYCSRGSISRAAHPPGNGDRSAGGCRGAGFRGVRLPADHQSRHVHPPAAAGGETADAPGTGPRCRTNTDCNRQRHRPRRTVRRTKPPGGTAAGTPARTGRTGPGPQQYGNTAQQHQGQRRRRRAPAQSAAGPGLCQSGKLDAARQLYTDAARSDPRNINAQLGLAAIAMQEGRREEASRLYFNVLDLEPRNAYAQTGLIAMMGRADPAAAESKLKQLIAREPLASLYFTLGNLYGDQSRWAEAQQAYFQAHQMEPANPDYAYNLAVGLEHIGQPRLATGFYQRAVEQAKSKGRVGFNLAQAQDRIRQLAAQPQ